MMKIIILPFDNAQQRKLLAHIAARLRYLKPKQRYSLEAILGPKFWEDVDDSHISLGHCFCGLVRKGRVPFAEAGWTSNRHNSYRYMPFGTTPATTIPKTLH
jgi:hypothetical protein